MSKENPTTQVSGGGGASGGSAPHLTISIPPGPEELLDSYERGGVAEAKKLLKRSPKLFVSQKLDDGEGLLSFAIGKKYYDLCEVLLVAGENPGGILQAGPDKDFTFLHSAAMEGDAKTVKLLLAFGADINRVCGRDLSVLDVAVGKVGKFLNLSGYRRKEECKEVRAAAEKRFAESEPAAEVVAPRVAPVASRKGGERCDTQ